MHRPAQRFRLLAAAWGFAWAVLAFPANAEGGEWYFLMVFGAQRVPNRPNYSHSFATFIRAVDDDTRPDNYTLESQTISWLPETLDIHTFRLLPERGHNLDLATTLAAVRSMGDRVSMWGPYQIREELYDRALVQIGRLESGSIAYKAVDVPYRSSRVSNCIHALSDVTDGQRRLRVACPGFGEIASSHIVRRYERWMIDPEQTYDWVAVRLGVDLDALIRRNLADRPRIFPHRCFPPTSR